MNLKANKRSMALLVVLTLIWPSFVQAFFCFSVGAGAGNKQRYRHYVRPPPPAGFDTVTYPMFHYSPIPQNPSAMYDWQLNPVLPAAPGEAVKQQIFE